MRRYIAMIALLRLSILVPEACATHPTTRRASPKRIAKEAREERQEKDRLKRIQNRYDGALRFANGYRIIEGDFSDFVALLSLSSHTPYFQQLRSTYVSAIPHQEFYSAIRTTDAECISSSNKIIWGAVQCYLDEAEDIRDLVERSDLLWESMSHALRETGYFKIGEQRELVACLVKLRSEFGAQDRSPVRQLKKLERFFERLREDRTRDRVRNELRNSLGFPGGTLDELKDHIIKHRILPRFGNPALGKLRELVAGVIEQDSKKHGLDAQEEDKPKTIPPMISDGMVVAKR